MPSPRSSWDELSLAAQEDWERTGGHPVAFDTETTGFNYTDTPFCVTVAWRRDDGSLASHYLEVEHALTDPGVGVAERILTEAPRLIGHNLRFDLQMVWKHGIVRPCDTPVERWEDTETICHLLNENKRKGLKFVAEHLLGETNDEAEVLAAHRRKLKVKKSEGYHVLDREVVMPYALKDAEYTLRIWERLYPHVLKDDQLHDLYRREMEVMRVLAGIYAKGMRVDIEKLEDRKAEYAKRVLKAELMLREMAGDEEFNPNSWQQVLGVFESIGIKAPADTSRATLTKLAERNSKAGRFAAALLRYRDVSKLFNTYLLGLSEEVTADGLLHVNIRQNGARTGRTSSAAEGGDA